MTQEPRYPGTGLGRCCSKALGLVTAGSCVLRGTMELKRKNYENMMIYYRLWSLTMEIYLDIYLDGG